MDIDDVLDPDRHPVQRPAVASGLQLGVEINCLDQSAFSVHNHPGPDLVLSVLNSIKARLEDALAGDLALAKPPGGTGNRLVVIGKELHRSPWADEAGLYSCPGGTSGETGARIDRRSPGGTRIGWSARTGEARSVDSSRAPRLTLAEVIDERLAGDPGQVGHRDALNGSGGRESDQRSLEQAGDQRCGRFDQPELERGVDHLGRRFRTWPAVTCIP